MPRRAKKGFGRWFEDFATRATQWTGRPAAFGFAAGVVLAWLASGPVFHFSDTWQLVINTGTTIVTFLMVFLIQHTQNKDTQAMELKLNELVAAMEGASNRLIDVEALTSEELETLHRHYRRLVAMAKAEDTLTRSHSVEEAESRHRSKKRRERSGGA
jgi:low affinity Fe/Cu permease